MRMNSIALCLFAALAFQGQLLAHEGHTHKVMGTVTAVDARHLEMDTKDDKKVSILVNEETKYVKGKEAATAADVKVGDRIVVTVVEKEGKKTAREILLASASQGDSSRETDPKTK